jgi:hypothetical protein
MTALTGWLVGEMMGLAAMFIMMNAGARLGVAAGLGVAETAPEWCTARAIGAGRALWVRSNEREGGYAVRPPDEPPY